MLMLGMGCAVLRAAASIGCLVYLGSVSFPHSSRFGWRDVYVLGAYGHSAVSLLLVLIGLVRTCKDRRYLWLGIALLAFAIWFIGVTTEGTVKHLLAGFWYTDYYRTGAMAALFAIPLAAMGFAWLFEGLKAQLEKRLGVRRQHVLLPSPLQHCSHGCFAVQFSLHTKVDDSDIRAGLMAVHKQVKQRYSWEKYFTGEEDAFVKKCMEAIPEGAVVANSSQRRQLLRLRNRRAEYVFQALFARCLRWFRGNRAPYPHCS